MEAQTLSDKAWGPLVETALPTLRVAVLFGSISAVWCELLKTPLLMSFPILTHDSKRYFSHSRLKKQQRTPLITLKVVIH